MMIVPYINLAKQNSILKKRLDNAFHRVLRKGNFILGDEVEKFEKQFSSYCDSRYAVGINSGTDALLLALRIANISPGDEVITVSHSFVATASAIVLAGATPVFVDIDWDQNINPRAIEPAITKKTKAIIPVHLTGKPAKMDLICAIAKKHNLVVIEDAAQAVGALYKGKKVGSFGDFGCFSLHPLKNLSACGDGGVITTQRSLHAARLKILRNIGLKDRDTCVEISGNSRLDELQAAFVNEKLTYLAAVIRKRRKLAKIYIQHLKLYVRVPEEVLGERQVFHTFVIQTNKRDRLGKFLRENGIDTKIHYPHAIHHHKPFARYAQRAHLPVADTIVKRILSLPIDHTLSEKQIEYVCSKILQFFKK